MLFYEQLDAFVIRPEDILESVKRFIKRHFPCSTDQIICVRDNLFFRRLGEIIFFWKPESFRFQCGYARPDVAFDNINKRFGEAEVPSDRDACQRMVNPVRPRSADVMKQAALSHQPAI